MATASKEQRIKIFRGSHPEEVEAAATNFLFSGEWLVVEMDSHVAVWPMGGSVYYLTLLLERAHYTDEAHQCDC